MCSIMEDVNNDENIKNSSKNCPLHVTFAQNKYTKLKTPAVSYFFLFRFATTRDKIFILMGTICAILCGFLFPCMTYLFAIIAGHIVHYSTIISSNATDLEKYVTMEIFIEQGKYSMIYVTLLGILILSLTYIGNTLFCLSAARQVNTIRKSYFSSMLEQDIGWYDVNQTADFASSLAENLPKVEQAIGEKLAIFIFFKVIFFVSTIFSLILGWELTLVGLISLPVSWICMGAITWLTSRFTKKELEAYASASTIAEEVLASIRTVFAFDGQEKENERYQKHLQYARRVNILRLVLSGINIAVMWAIIYGCHAVTIWYGVKLIIREKNLPDEQRTYTPKSVIAIFGFVGESCWFFGQGAPYLELFGVAKEAAAKIFATINHNPIVNKSKTTGDCLENMEGHISFKNVNFSYSSREDVKILDDLNFEVTAGETVALVGSSGCGKSTIIQLIQRFYDTSSGMVTVDGRDVKSLNLNWLRSKIGVVSQEPVLFAASIEENIKYGNPSATQIDIELAAKKANAHEFIIHLPHGYKTIVGEKGAQMSGGQKQRIAIARALVRQPAILLLDEATSALDTTSETMVQKALDKASSNCTTIIVAHRLSTIRNANRIMVIANGRVVEHGTHQKLMSLQGSYYKLITSNKSNADKESDTASIENTHTGSVTQEIVNKINKTILESDQKEESSSSSLEGFSSNEKKSSAFVDIVKTNKPEWLFIFLGCSFSLLVGACLTMFALIYGEFIGVLSSENNDYLTDQANTLSLYFCLLGVFVFIGASLQSLMFAISGENLTMRLRARMFDAMMKQEIGWFDRKDNGVGALCSRLSSQASSVQGASGQCLGTILNNAATFLISIGMALYFHLSLSLVALAFFPLVFITIYFENKIVYGEDDAKTLEAPGNVAIEAISNIKTVASLGCEEIFYKRFTTELQPHQASAKKKSHFRGFMLGLARSTAMFSYVATLYYGMHLMVNSNLSSATLFKVTEAVIFGSWSIGSAMAYASNVQQGLSAAGEVFKLLKRVPHIRNSEIAHSNSWQEANVEFSNVYFSYPTRPSVSVLKGFDMSVLHGKTVALVGQSGCGKSTVIQLLQRFYEPKVGEIRVDNDLIQNYNLTTLRSQMGIVFQEPNLFDRTISENIAYGANDSMVSTQEIIEAAKKANLHEFISSLPQGYSTKLGEKGAQLSGGQKQRVAIARALIRNPKILLLDEATSALDNNSEKIVQVALNNARKGRTCITIAHRLSTIQDANVIFVVSDGMIVESGSHMALLQNKGLYYKFYSSQDNIG